MRYIGDLFVAAAAGFIVGVLLGVWYMRSDPPRKPAIVQTCSATGQGTVRCITEEVR